MKARSQVKKAGIVRVVLPILFGGLIYCSLRDSKLALFQLIHSNTLDRLMLSLKGISSPIAGLAPEWFSHSLPDALWSYACVSFVLICWRGESSFCRGLWLCFAVILSLGFEVGQLLNLIPGTFCFHDFLFSIIAIALALLTEAVRKAPVKAHVASAPLG